MYKTSMNDALRRARGSRTEQDEEWLIERELFKNERLVGWGPQESG